MTKEEYFATPWHYEDCGIRAIDASGQEFYFSAKPIRISTIWVTLNIDAVKYESQDVADWWHESLQTRDEYLELQKSKINENVY
jgi:hypothetical protein